MRRMLVHMIAAGSLSAFSTAAGIGASSAAAPRSGVQRVRTPPTPAQSQPLALQPSDTGKTGAPQPGRILPRGSLLDLSV